MTNIREDLFEELDANASDGVITTALAQRAALKYVKRALAVSRLTQRTQWVLNAIANGSEYSPEFLGKKFDDIVVWSEGSTADLLGTDDAEG